MLKSTGFLAFIALAFPVTAQAPEMFGSRASPFDLIMCDSDIECEEATGYPYSTALDGGPKYPRLVGIGCEGTTGAPIYAFEEDHFPEGGCREIFPMDWDWQERVR